MKPYQQKIEKPWGYELLLTSSDVPVTGKILHIDQGKRFSYQYHDKKRETLCLFSGKALIVLDGKESNMELKKGYYIEPMVKHRCQAVSDCDILEFSTREEGNTIRLQDDYSRSDETEEIRKQPNRGWTAHGQK